MDKEELFKKYQDIVLKTNGGNNDYVVALCQISNLIKDYAEEKEDEIETAKECIPYDAYDWYEALRTYKQKCKMLEDKIKEKDEQLNAFQTLITCGQYTTPNTETYQTLMELNTKQICDKIKMYDCNVNKQETSYTDYVIGLIEFLNKIEKGE